MKNKQQTAPKEHDNDRAAEDAQPDVSPENISEKQPQQEEADAPQESGEEAVSETPDDESVEGLKEQLKTFNDKYIRLMAEFENFKRRTSREYERMVAAANEKLMLELISVREDFERALKAEHRTGDLETFVKGTELIFNRFETILKNNGLESFAQEGEAFDPEYHDAMMKNPHESIPEDHIVQVFERGYMLKKRIVKHAKVVVSSGPPPKEQVQEDDTAATGPDEKRTSENE